MLEKELSEGNASFDIFLLIDRSISLGPTVAIFRHSLIDAVD